MEKKGVFIATKEASGGVTELTGLLIKNLALIIVVEKGISV